MTEDDGDLGDLLRRWEAHLHRSEALLRDYDALLARLDGWLDGLGARIEAGSVGVVPRGVMDLVSPVGGSFAPVCG